MLQGTQQMTKTTDVTFDVTMRSYPRIAHLARYFKPQELTVLSGLRPGDLVQASTDETEVGLQRDVQDIPLPKAALKATTVQALPRLFSVCDRYAQSQPSEVAGGGRG